MDNISLIAGVDEAGRGPLAGPVFAAAVILNPDKPIAGLLDSKLLTPKRRAQLFIEIKAQSLAWSIASAEVNEIDEINILQASLLAMQRAASALNIVPELILIDGNQCPKHLPCKAQAIVKGDQKIPAISAASILAKVARDEMMCELDIRYPGYGFAGHKGYGTKAHLEALKNLGVSPVHRKSFAPVSELLVAVV